MLSINLLEYPIPTPTAPSVTKIVTLHSTPQLGIIDPTGKNPNLNLRLKQA